MKKRLPVTGCLLLLFPHTASAAQDLAPLAATPSFFLLLLSLLLLGAVCALWLRLQRSKRENNDVLVRLQLAQQVLEQAPLDILLTDPDLRIVQANQAALQSAGEQPLIGRGLLELKPGLAGHPVVSALQAGAREAVSVQAPDFRIPADHGASGQETLVLGAAGTQKIAVWYGTGGSAREEGEEERTQTVTERASQAVESASRMKSEFIANINHEIRTPMNAIIGYAEMLINANLGTREKRFANIIHKSSLALVSIFNDIMELSKIDSGRMQIMFSSVRLQSIINEVEDLFKEQAYEKELRLRCRVAPHLPKILILDGLRLKQVLQNFVSNAIKFTAKGYVELMVDGGPSQEKAGCIDLRFTVEDSGVGIPAADQEKIFELFQQQEETISRQYGGIGLGLTLCSRLIAMMDGRIELFSNEGGTRFTVFLNAIKVAEQVPAKLSADVTLVHDRVQKLLVVDDMDLIKDVFIDFFQDSPFKILTANNGEEALTLAAREKPGIIFMDLNLVGMDGRTVTEGLRKQRETATIPVVVMTGEILEEADYKPLFNDFLQKPFRLDELKEIVARYVQSGLTDKALHDTLRPMAADNDGGEEQASSFAGIEQVWTAELEQLRCQAARSGSLADAVSLGAAMLKAGESTHQSLLSELGGELIQHAAEPNILGVDRLLAKLSRIADRKQP